MASEAAQEDLTEFFEMWGFFVTVDTQIDQYGSYQYTVTKEMIENAKKAMAKYPKKAKPFYYLEDRKKGDIGYYSTGCWSLYPVSKDKTYNKGYKRKYQRTGSEHYKRR